MKTVYRVEALPPLIPIGVQTEDGVSTVDFDVSAWLETWPDLSISAMHTRPGELSPYPVVCRQAGTILTWQVSIVDTELPGQGKIELIGLAPGRRKLSGAAYTHIEETSCSTSGEAPSVMAPFVDSILQAAARAEDAAERAESAGGGSGGPGQDGFSPVAAVEATAYGALITITDKTGTTAAEIHHGQDGRTPVKGVDYFDGAKGDPGKDGKTPVKGVDYFDGAKGDPGKDGKTPVKGVDYFDGQDGTSVMVTNISTSSADGGSNVVTFSDGKTLTVKNGSKGSPGANGTTPVKGVDYFDGAKGDPGQNGVSPTVSTSKSGKVTTITIRDASGTKTATINDGQDGQDGMNGQDGTNGVGVKSVTQTTTSSADGGSNVITVTKTDGTTSTFTVKNGSKGSPGTDGKTPVKGTDYFTAADKADMVTQVKAALPKLTLSGVDADGVTHTYTLYGE